MAGYGDLGLMLAIAEEREEQKKLNDLKELLTQNGISYSPNANIETLKEQAKELQSKLQQENNTINKEKQKNIEQIKQTLEYAEGSVENHYKKIIEEETEETIKQTKETIKQTIGQLKQLSGPFIQVFENALSTSKSFIMFVLNVSRTLFNGLCFSGKYFPQLIFLYVCWSFKKDIIAVVRKRLKNSGGRNINTQKNNNKKRGTEKRNKIKKEKGITYKRRSTKKTSKSTSVRNRTLRLSPM